MKRSFKPYQNEHNSVKDTREKGKNQCKIDLKISMKFLSHYPPSSETQGQSVGSGEKAGRKFSGKGGRAPGYRLLPDHFQKFHPRTPRGSQSAREKRRDESFQVWAKEPLGTDSHRTISKNSSGCRLLIGHKKCFVLLCPIGEQFLLSSFREFVHDSYCLATLARFVHQACAYKGNFYFLLSQPETKELPMI